MQAPSHPSPKAPRVEDAASDDDAGKGSAADKMEGELMLKSRSIFGYSTWSSVQCSFDRRDATFRYSSNASIKVARVQAFPDRPNKRCNRFNLHSVSSGSASVALFASDEAEMQRWIGGMQATVVGHEKQITWHEVKGHCRPSPTLLEKDEVRASVAWDSGASSVDAIGWSESVVQGVSWMVQDNSKGFMMGLSHVDRDETFNTINYALACNARATLGVYEDGALIFQHGGYAPGDQLAVLVQDNTVCFVQNEVVFFTSPTRPLFPLVVDTSFFHPGARAHDVKLLVAELTRRYSLRNIQMDSPAQTRFRTLTVGHDRREIAYIKLAAATNGFTSALLGQGGFATVHLGQLGGQKVAIKKEKQMGKRMNAKGKKFLDDQFLLEVLVMYEAAHPNIARLLGHSIDGPGRCLVYEFCANGALEDRLRRPTTERPAYSWSQRLTLAVESARALVYLHTLPKPIVHRDIKSSNVLVSDEYHAKLCDFGTVRKMTMTKGQQASRAKDEAGAADDSVQGKAVASDESRVQSFQGSFAVSLVKDEIKIGTSAYMPPEHAQSGDVSVKTDAFGLGVVYLEILTGSKPTEARHTVLPALLRGEDCPLDAKLPDWHWDFSWADEEGGIQDTSSNLARGLSAQQHDEIGQMISKGEGEGEGTDSGTKQFAAIALSMLCADPAGRKSVEEVLPELESLLDVERSGSGGK